MMYSSNVLLQLFTSTVCMHGSWREGAFDISLLEWIHCTWITSQKSSRCLVSILTFKITERGCVSEETIFSNSVHPQLHLHGDTDDLTKRLISNVYWQRLLSESKLGLSDTQVTEYHTTEVLDMQYGNSYLLRTEALECRRKKQTKKESNGRSCCRCWHYKSKFMMSKLIRKD